jgi:hypothetical protein
MEEWNKYVDEVEETVVTKILVSHRKGYARDAPEQSLNKARPATGMEIFNRYVSLAPLLYSANLWS